MICPNHVQGSEGKPCTRYIQGGFCTLPTQFRCSEYILRKEMRLSQSAFKAYKRCPRAYYYAHVARLQTTDTTIPITCGKFLANAMRLIHDHEKDPQQLSSSVEQLMKQERLILDQGNEQLLLAFDQTGVLIQWYIETAQYESLRGKPEFYFNVHDIHGYVDVFLESSRTLVEMKLTQRMENYTLWTIQSQVSFYLLALPEVDRVLLRLIRRPDLRLGKKERIPELLQRLWDDLSQRPKYYIKDYLFYREEFDLKRIQQEIAMIEERIIQSLDEGIEGFWCNDAGCFSPFQCEFLSICENGGLIPEGKYLQCPTQEGVQ